MRIHHHRHHGRRAGSRLRLPAALLLAFMALMPALGGLALGVGGSAPAVAYAQEKQYHMDRYDADITVNTDGSLDVVETLTYVFTSGSFRRGLRFWDTGKLESITGLAVAEVRNGGYVDYNETRFDPDDSTSGVPGTFGIERSGSTERTRWIFGTTSNDSRTFRLTYHVNGAIRVYNDRDEFDWYAVPPDWGAPINNSSVTVRFPEGTNTSDWQTASVPTAFASKEGSTITWSASGGLGNGFEVGAQVPKGILSATKPSWQERVDQEEKSREDWNRNVRPLLDFGLLLLGAIVGVGGVLWAIMRWYRQGRDKPVALPTDYLPEPPSDLPPGLVGTLLDESADVRDVIATIVDQGRKGNLTIAETGGAGLFQSRDYTYNKTAANVSYRFEQMALDALFSKGSPVNLSELKNSFYSKLPPLYDEMYKTLVALKYFPENPKAVRARNIGCGGLFIFLAFFVFMGGIVFGDVFSYMLIVPGIALGIVGVVWMITGTAMPRKTDLGSEEAAKWRAFKRYLEQIKSYTNVQEAADRFQKYLPYAVALGVDREFITQFNSVPQAMPPWYSPYGYYPYPYVIGTPGGYAGAGTGGTGGGAPGGFDPGGAMQGMSDSLAGAMQGLSDSFTNMVNSASSIMTSQPSSSGGSGGGGWGGGGGGFGGGGGGGGGGGAD